MKKLRILISFLALCFSFFVLTFGVYAVSTVSYELAGTLTYDVTDAYVTITSSVYKYTGGVLNQTELNNLGESARTSTTNLVDLNNTHTYSALDSTGTPAHNYGALSFAFSGNDVAYAYVFIIEISNLSPDIKVWAQVNALPDNVSNILTYKSLAQKNITPTASKKLVVAVTVNEWNKKVTTANFNFSITATAGEVPNNVETYNEVIYNNRYVQVEYIESHAQEYIDVGLNGKATMEYETEVYLVNGEVAGFFGESNYAWNRIGIFQNSGTGRIYPMVGEQVYVGFMSNRWVHIRLNDNVFSVNQDSINIAGYSAGNSSLSLFAMSSYKIKTKMKYFKLYDNDVLVRNYVACYDTENEEYGMYDLVTNTFYGNVSGAGAFTGGAVVEGVNVMPVRYQQVEYIESHAQECIDTGVQITTSISVETHIYIPVAEREVDQYHFLFGAQNGMTWDVATLQFGVCWGNYDKIMARCGESGVDTASNIYYAVGEYTISLNKDKFVINGNGYDVATTLQAMPRNLYVFGTNKNNEEAGALARYRLYSFVIKEGTTLVRDFIPVYDTVDEVYGLYDMVTDTFFGNVGSGAFTGGNAV